MGGGGGLGFLGKADSWNGFGLLENKLYTVRFELEDEIVNVAYVRFVLSGLMLLLLGIRLHDLVLQKHVSDVLVIDDFHLCGSVYHITDYLFLMSILNKLKPILCI